MTDLLPRSSGCGAATRLDHEDPTLRGRRYAIPYQLVWVEAVRLVNSRSPRWSLLEANDQTGCLRAESTSVLFHLVDDVEIRIHLDSDAQTRVDLTSRSRWGKWDLGVNARRIRHFLRDLDSQLRPRPNVVLPPEMGFRPMSSPSKEPAAQSGTN